MSRVHVMSSKIFLQFSLRFSNTVHGEIITHIWQNNKLCCLLEVVWWAKIAADKKPSSRFHNSVMILHYSFLLCILWIHVKNVQSTKFWNFHIWHIYLQCIFLLAAYCFLIILSVNCCLFLMRLKQADIRPPQTASTHNRKYCKSTEVAVSFHDSTLPKQKTYAVGKPQGRREIPQLLLLKYANW